MKIGNLKVKKEYSKGNTKWAIYGRKHKGVWTLCNFEDKNLIFDLEYDACSFLASLFEESLDREVAKKGYGATQSFS